MNDQAAKELIREIAGEHGIAIDRDDPILILQTATRKVLLDAVHQAQQNVDQALARHRSELEVASAKWREDSKLSASHLIQQVEAAIAPTLAREAGQAAAAAATQLKQAFDGYEKALARSTLACALAAAVALLAAAVFVWASGRAVGLPAATERQCTVDSTCR